MLKLLLTLKHYQYTPTLRGYETQRYNYLYSIYVMTIKENT